MGTYRLLYKSDPLTGESGLSHILTPLGIYRTFVVFTSLGVERLTLFPWSLEIGSTTSPAFIYDWETRLSAGSTFQGYPLARFTWPSGRRVNQLWTKRLIVYDNVQIHWDGDNLIDSSAVNLHDVVNAFELKEQRHFGAGTLVTHVKGDVSLAGSRGKLLAYSYEYEFDHSFMVSV